MNMIINPIYSKSPRKHLNNNLGRFTLKGSKTQIDLANYDTNEHKIENNSLDADLYPMSRSVLKSTTNDRQPIKKEIPKVEINGLDVLSMTGTLRSSYDLLNEAQNQKKGSAYFKNTLRKSTMSDRLDKVRNSESPLKDYEIKIKNIQIKRQSTHETHNQNKIFSKVSSTINKQPNLNKNIDLLENSDEDIQNDKVDDVSSCLEVNKLVDNSIKYKVNIDDIPIKPAKNTVYAKIDLEDTLCDIKIENTTKDQIKGSMQTHNYEVNAHQVCINITQESRPNVLFQPMGNKEDQEVIVNTPLFTKQHNYKMSDKSKPEINSKQSYIYSKENIDKNNDPIEQQIKPSFLKKGTRNNYDPKKAIESSIQLKMFKCRSNAKMSADNDLSSMCY
jgi:hypothetical protein